MSVIALHDVVESRVLTPSHQQVSLSLKERQRLTVVDWLRHDNCLHNKIETLIEGRAPSNILAIAKNKSKATLYRWVKEYQQSGKLARAQSTTKSNAQAWHLQALNLYQQPQKLSKRFILKELHKKGFQLSYDQLKRYFRSLPISATDQSPRRIGANYKRNNLGHYISRDYDSLPAGHWWVGDGHTIDCYVAHPSSAKPYRPELTMFMDMKSRFIVGFHISRSESAMSTMLCLTRAMSLHNHVPPALLVDNGSGYTASMMTEKQNGFFQRNGMEVIFAIPGNPKAKPIERFFLTLRNGLDKRFYTYCGKDMTGEILRKRFNEVNKNQTNLPTLQDYQNTLLDFLNEYHNTAHSALNNKTPAEIWATRTVYPVHTSLDDLTVLTRSAKVVRGAVTVDGRKYKHADLIHLNSKEVTVVSSLVDDSQVTIEIHNQVICVAKLWKKKHALPASRIEEQKRKATLAATKRLQKKIAQRKIEEREPISLQDPRNLQFAQSILLDQGITPSSPSNKEEVDEFVKNVFLTPNNNKE